MKRQQRPPLPAEIVQRILALAPTNKQQAIADELGVSQPAVSNVLVRHGFRRFRRRITSRTP